MNEAYIQEFTEWMKVAKRDLRGAHKLNDGEDSRWYVITVSRQQRKP